MKQVHQFSKLLTGRVALNAYFWLISIFLAFVVNFHGRGAQYNYAHAWYTLFRIITTCMIAAVLYINNFLLVPKYLHRRLTGIYIGLMLAICYVDGLLLTACFKYLSDHFPAIDYPDVSVIDTLHVVNPSVWIVTLLQAAAWALALLVYIVAFTVAWYMRDYTKQIRHREEAQRRQVEAELKFLKSQINPHFLFNTLNNLYTLTVLKSDDAPETVSRLSLILRYMLYESNVPLVPFEKEKEIMHAYIDLELLRLGQKDDLHFTIIADADYQVPPLLWMSTLENVFKHGTRFLSQDYFIDYKVAITNGRLDIYSKNRFKEGSDNKLEAGSGIGLANLRKRLELLFPGRYAISAKAENSYFITQITVDLL